MTASCPPAGWIPVHSDLCADGVPLRCMDDSTIWVAARDGRLVVDAEKPHSLGARTRTPLSLPHSVLGVFPVRSDLSEHESRVYAVVDGPYHLAEIDVLRSPTGKPIVVWQFAYDAATQAEFMPRAFSDMSIDKVMPTAEGRFVAVARTDSTVVVYRVCSDRGKPTLEARQFMRLGPKQRAEGIIWYEHEVDADSNDKPRLEVFASAPCGPLLKYSIEVEVGA